MSHSESVYLRPCPFCGNTVEDEGISVREVLYWKCLGCGVCGAQGPFGEDPNEAAELWNGRVTHP